MAEITIAGKRVVLRERFPLKDNADLLKAWREAKSEDMQTVVPLCIRHVESWEFEGNPADPESWQELDVLTEIRPIWAAVNDAMYERVIGTPGKSESASSSASLDSAASG